jgi:hypothetical protein
VKVPVDNPLEKSLCYEQQIPLQVTAVGELTPDQQLANDASNEGLLLRLESMETVHAEADESNEMLHEIRRLENKVDLALDLIMDLVSKSSPQPPSTHVRFNEYGLEWQGVSGLAAGSKVLISLYLNPRFPRPLFLTGTLLQRDPNIVEFDEMPETINDYLTRFIFRQHRRQIARQRT